jgi:hypothetical protein
MGLASFTSGPEGSKTAFGRFILANEMAFVIMSGNLFSLSRLFLNS